MTTTLRNTIPATSSSRWSHVRKYKSLVKSKILRWFFCVDDTLLNEIEEESAIRDEIRDAMVQHESACATGCQSMAVVEITKDIYNESGYDLCNYQSQVDKITSSTDDVAEFFDALQDKGLSCVVAEPITTARVVPRFAAAVVLCLRSKFGNLGANEANRLLIEREYLKVCRDCCVRNVDVVMHQQWVLNAYFSEGVMEELATVRTRVPRWLREAFGSVPRAAPTIC